MATVGQEMETLDISAMTDTIYQNLLTDLDNEKTKLVQYRNNTFNEMKKDYWNRMSEISNTAVSLFAKEYNSADLELIEKGKQDLDKSYNKVNEILTDYFEELAAEQDKKYKLLQTDLKQLEIECRNAQKKEFNERKRQIKAANVETNQIKLEPNAQDRYSRNGSFGQ